MARNRRRKALPRDPVILDIEKLSHEGRGIAYREGKVVFVEEALSGEQVEAIFTSRRDSFDEARAQRVLVASPERVESQCSYASLCGGCSLQHFDSESQLAFKEAVLHEKLQHSTGRQDYEHLPPIKGPAFHYRRKARLAVRYVQKKSEVLVGFREKRSSFITQMDSCEVLDPQVSNLLPELKLLILSLRSYQHIPQIEVAVGDKLSGCNSLALVVRNLQELEAEDLDKLKEFARQHEVDLYLQPGGVPSVKKLYPEDTPSRLYYVLPDYDLRIAFHPMDFTQVNAEINQKMLKRAMELLQLQAEDQVLDLFCGLGNFTFPMARYCRQVTGVEGVDEMVQRGFENARLNSIDNVSFHCADLSKPLHDEPWLQKSYSKVLLDPPRSGALEILPSVIARKPEKIVYISCNPATLARDAAVLIEAGYALRAAGVLDMFPQTTHVESIALFEPK